MRVCEKLKMTATNVSARQVCRGGKIKLSLRLGVLRATSSQQVAFELQGGVAVAAGGAWPGGARSGFLPCSSLETSHGSRHAATHHDTILKPKTEQKMLQTLSYVEHLTAWVGILKLDLSQHFTKQVARKGISKGFTSLSMPQHSNPGFHTNTEGK